MKMTTSRLLMELCDGWMQKDQTDLIVALFCGASRRGFAPAGGRTLLADCCRLRGGCGFRGPIETSVCRLSRYLETVVHKVCELRTAKG
jgi:hypothetical protein